MLNSAKVVFIVCFAWTCGVQAMKKHLNKNPVVPEPVELQELKVVDKSEIPEEKVYVKSYLHDDKDGKFLLVAITRDDLDSVNAARENGRVSFKEGARLLKIVKSKEPKVLDFSLLKNDDIKDLEGHLRLQFIVNEVTKGDDIAEVKTGIRDQSAVLGILSSFPSGFIKKYKRCFSPINDFISSIFCARGFAFRLK